MKHLALSSLTTGLAGLFTLLGTPIAEAQTVPVQGGFLQFEDSRIFVPNTTNVPPEVWQGENPSSYLIRLPQGDLMTLNAIFRTSILPQLDIAPNGTPAAGNTGSVQGTLTFRGFSTTGQPTTYLNLPTELQFQVEQINLASNTGSAFIRYNTNPLLLTERGVAVSSGGGSTVERNTPVVLVQFQPDGSNPTDQPFAPASEFIFANPGLSYDADFSADLTGGSVDIPNPPGLGSIEPDIATLNLTASTPVTLVLNSIQRFNIINIDSVTPFTTFGNQPFGVIGVSPTVAVLPSQIITGVFVFTLVPSGNWFDPPMADSFEYEMIASEQPVGLSGRVFPGMTGTEEVENSLFTEISGLPTGIDADDRFTVSVEGVVLGEFSAADTVNFADYAEELGDLLVDGEGVKKFTISDIDPSVDSENPLAFPVKLEFNTPTASFEMRASGENLDENAQVSILSEEMMSKRQARQADLANRREAIITEVTGESPVISIRESDF
ncbi:MAG: hypothetical protein F6K03_00490 [Kamptonema sp. SIO4C4]|nr:hypothetical protein [Kamptonema sp. SIO4C4]